mgnify:FL=1
MDINKKIENILREIETKEQVKILLAVESGSRAWGFASPDSDYDVRFIYVRPMEEYLRLDAPRDVIEWQLDEVLDVNGWDLKKALIQFHKGNPVLFEWSNSPIQYKTTEAWEEIYRTASAYFSAKSGVCHYYGTARNTFETYLTGEQVKYKKYFYALRPLLACRYIETQGGPPPVLFDRLLDLPLPQVLKEDIDRLIRIKKATAEADARPQMPGIYQFIKNELDVQKTYADSLPDDHRQDWRPLNRAFLHLLENFGGSEDCSHDL